MSDKKSLIYCDRCKLYLPENDFIIPGMNNKKSNLCSNCIIEVGNILLKDELKEFSELIK